ncbi:patellin-3-like [Mercurialis annua]|uniref:patellin-3-like n=1 Tax=Mercurialis annua TaxID=3986 RepID=UPI00215E97A7|nr:patellin-3-like [Mercurialis annua]
MAEETQKPAAAPSSTTVEEVVVVEKPLVTEKESLPSAPEPESPEKPAAAVATPAEAVAVEDAVVEALKEETSGDKAGEEEVKISQSVSFKEETNVVGELPEVQKKALDELKQLIQEALVKHEFTAPPPPPPPPAAAKEEEKAEKTEEPKVEEVKVAEEKTSTDAPSTSEEAKPVEAETAPVKAEEKAVEEKKEEKVEEKAVVPAEAVVVAETKVTTVVDEDGAKTVEAIEETVVPVSAPVPAEEPAAPAKEAETTPAAEEEPKTEETPAPPPPPEEVFIWGIPILGDEKSDVILLKFLRARDFKAKDAFTMIKNTVRWRKEFGIDALLEEDLGNELEKAVFMHGFDKEGHPVCYNVFGAFQDKELYQNCFSDEEKRVKFLRWRIQFLEKSIRNLDFSPNGICTIVQVNDLKNSPGPAKRELRQATNQALAILQDNYPEFVAKQVFINVPWWYLAFNRMISPFLTQRTKSKFVFAGPSKSAETLFKYVSAEQVLVQYGGLKREGDQEFGVNDSVTEVTIKPATKHTVEFSSSETCQLVWELRVVGWDVSYVAEFVPSAEDGYTVIVSKTRKISSTTDEPIISDLFKISEPGKVVLTIDNQTSKKKKLLYRSKTKPLSE